VHEPCSTAEDRERLRIYADAYREGHSDAFSNGWSEGYSAGLSIYKQRLLDCFEDDEEIPARVAALLSAT